MKSLKCLLYGHEHINLNCYTAACKRCDAVQICEGNPEVDVLWTVFDWVGFVGIAKSYADWLIHKSPKFSIKCEQCGKKVYFWQGIWAESFCSDKCHNEWLPF